MHPFLSHRNYMALDTNRPRRNKVYAPAKDGLLRRSLRSIYQRWNRRRMIAELHSMNDRMLRDMGIYRNDIERVVNDFEQRDLLAVPAAKSSIKLVSDRDVWRLAA